ncbi:MAG TPA: UvrD-helicase domain-containing protein [Candidatus Peribacterales bacterium]|nr:UvrD-helicase domain-containing protein [Candidatus Peribacterales bacterium]
MSDLIFANLNNEQRRAVETVDGPVLILAGAGSGKTRALTHRIAYLIERGVEPWQILAVTFTNKAANEMKQRITNLLALADPNQKQLPVMGTFHSVCVRILRRDIEHIGRNRDFVIYDADDQEKLMKEVLREMNIDPKELKPKTALGHIGKFKNEALSAQDVAALATTDWMGRIVKIYHRYQSLLRTNNALDFDDLILESVRLFREAPAVLERYQNTWRYLNVDEYQDTNHTQYLLISLLAEKHRNLCVIGDPDQSIYAFRGADIRNILEFQREYQNAASIKLERNYRSTQQILDAADSVIAKNPGRPEKKMWTERIDGENITVQEVGDEKAEAREAVQTVMAAMSRGISLNEQVILYRTNAQSRLFEEACMRAGVPYRILGGVKFYARAEVKDVLAYLRVIHNPADAISLLRIINVPARKIGETTIAKIQAYCSKENIDLWTALTQIDVLQKIPEPTRNRIAAFVTLIRAYRERKAQMTVAMLAKELIAEIKLEEWMKDDTTEGESRWQNIGELLTVMHKYDQLPPSESLVSFLEEVALVSEVDKLEQIRSDALTLMTLHLCKGLEFRHVIIAGCEEGIFPHANALLDKEQLEEERRIMYVGMTRAKDELRLFAARSRSLWGSVQTNEASRFLDDIPPELVERKSDASTLLSTGDVMNGALWNIGSSRAIHSTDSTHHILDIHGKRGSRETNKTKLQPFRQHQELSIEFNQDALAHDDVNQDAESGIAEGSRIRHPVFGLGTVTGRRGDIVDVTFDSGEKKRLALSIAPLEVA